MKPEILVKSCLYALLAALVAGCHVHKTVGGTPSDTGLVRQQYEIERELRDIEYSAPGWPQVLRADLLLPRRDGPLPVVLTIHGGGWANRSRDDMQSIAGQLVERGYAVLNLDYRFAPRYRYPAQIDDLRLALDWVHRNADRYRFDTTRVSAWGYSSGAHLAALLGAVENRRPNDDATPLPRLRAVVAGGIPADLRVYEESPIVERFMGGRPADMPQRYAEASPLYHVSADDPAVFLYHGNLDMLVEPEQSTIYYDALVDAGVDSELFLHNWRGHMTMFLFGGSAEEQAIDFLDRVNSAD